MEFDRQHVGAGNLQESLAFELPGPSLRVFQRAVACLAKLGRDAAVILRADELVLHGADDAHSAAVQFAFRRRFFRATPASTGAPAVGTMREANVVVGARQLLVALKGAQQRTGQAESLCIGLSRPVTGARRISTGDQQQRLVLEFTARFGGKVRHRVPLLESMPFLPGEPNAGPHSAALSPSLLARVLDHCSPMSRSSGTCEEVTLSAVRGEGLRVQSYDLMSGGGVGGQANRTEVLIQRSDLEACSLDGRGGEVVFSGRGLRDFARAADACARDLEILSLVDGSALLELRFGAEGGSVACRLAAASDGMVRPLQDFSAVLIIATRQFGSGDTAAEGGNTTQGTLQGTLPATPAAARRPQARQGSTKRRAVATPAAAAEIFDGFPDHSGQIPRTQPSTGATPSRPPVPAASAWPTAADTQPTQPAQPAAPPANFPMQQYTAPVGVLPQAAPPMHAPAPVPAPVHAPERAAAAPPQPLRQQPWVVAGAVKCEAGASATGPVSAPWPGLQAASTVPMQPMMASMAPQVQRLPPQADSLPPTAPAEGLQGQMAATQPEAPAAVQPVGGNAWWQGGQAPPAQVLAGRVTATPLLASQLAKALQVPDSDDELIGADPDEVAFARGAPEEDSVDWFDVDKLW